MTDTPDLLSGMDLTDPAARQVASDLLETAGRDDEAALLRQPGAEVRTVDGNLVRAGVGWALLGDARAGKLVAEITDEEDVAPLASRGDAGSYPAVTIQLTAPSLTEPLDVHGWKVCWWEHGPNRRDNGAYLGPGWHFLTDNNDGQSSGRPSVRGASGRRIDWEETTTITIQDGHQAEAGWLDVADLTPAERAELAEAIQTVLTDVYDDWEPDEADSTIIYALLTSQRTTDADVEIDVAGETIRVGIYAGNQCGKPVFALADDEEETVYDDADDAVAAAKARLVKMLEDAVERAPDLNVSKVAATLRARAVEE